jgi:hypothetical protein
MSSGGGGLQKLCHCICKKKAESQPREWPAMFALTLICSLAVVLQAMRVIYPACSTARRLTASIPTRVFPRKGLPDAQRSRAHCVIGLTAIELMRRALVKPAVCFS